MLLTSDRNLQSDAFTGWRPAPWDVTDIVVEQTDDVLGIFDAETAATADAVMDATTAAARRRQRPGARVVGPLSPSTTSATSTPSTR